MYKGLTHFSFKNVDKTSIFFYHNPSPFYRHSTPTGCNYSHQPLAIDIAPLRGGESARETPLKPPKFVSGNLRYHNSSRAPCTLLKPVHLLFL